MKSLIKIFKKHSMLAVALGTVIGFSAFKMAEVKNNDPYYAHLGNGVYETTPLDMSKINQDWECLEDDTEICAAQFSAPPTDPNQTPDGEVILGIHVEK